MTRSSDGQNEQNFLTDYLGRMAALAAPTPERLGEISAIRDLWLACRQRGGRVWFLGNGGSAGSASHLAIDLAKNAKVPAATFNDVALITCLANDYGHDQWMAAALRLSAKPQDSLVAISASGRSPNILNAVAVARQSGMSIVTLSGFNADNPLRSLGTVNCWIDSHAYNVVEIGHQIICMAVIDLIIGKAEYRAN